MKKIFFSAALSVLTITSSFTGMAQDLAGGSYISPRSTRTIDPETNKANKILALNEVSIFASRDFIKSYSGAEDVTWVENKSGASVYFTLNGLKMRATYDKMGRKEYTLKYYDELAMSSELRHIVKSNYYDYKIDLVTEVERRMTTYYLVKMQNDKEHLTVRVVNGEISPFEHVQKAK